MLKCEMDRTDGVVEAELDRAMLDGLPYIDLRYGDDEESRAEAKELIEAEMRTFQPRDYLASLPLPSFSFEVACAFGVFVKCCVSLTSSHRTRYS